MVLSVSMMVSTAMVVTAGLMATATASVRSERQADLIRHQLLKDLGMETTPDTTKV